MRGDMLRLAESLQIRDEHLVAAIFPLHSPRRRIWQDCATAEGDYYSRLDVRDLGDFAQEIHI